MKNTKWQEIFLKKVFRKSSDVTSSTGHFMKAAITMYEMLKNKMLTNIIHLREQQINIMITIAT
jgi:hypothetical protein